ncbi:hypothetical protein SFRURICE_015562 [Spodoptera frugiperda]|nr:hypothetical protein SFRURICE_015562 [Spodoptera frugiperda]
MHFPSNKDLALKIRFDKNPTLGRFGDRNESTYAQCSLILTVFSFSAVILYKMKAYIAVFFLAASVLADPEPSKVVQKRSGLVGHFGAPLIGHGVALGHGYAGHLAGPIAAGHLGGPIAAGYAAGPYLGGPVGAAIVGADVHTTVTKHVGVPVPAPYPVPVDRPYPVAVKVAVPVPVDRPYAVPVPKPYPVTVEKHVAVPVDRPVPVPVPHAVPYPVIKQVSIGA